MYNAVAQFYIWLKNFQTSSRQRKLKVELVQTKKQVEPQRNYYYILCHIIEITQYNTN